MTVTEKITNHPEVAAEYPNITLKSTQMSVYVSV